MSRLSCISGGSRAIVLRCLFFAAVTALAGCVSYEPAPMDTTALVREHGQSSIDTAAVRRELGQLAPGYTWDGERWDRLALFAAALAQNPALEQSRAAVKAAAAEADAAGVRPGPTLSLAGEYAFNQPEPSPWLLGVGGDLPVDFGARRESRIDIARLQARISLIDYLDSAWSVRSSVRGALAGHLLAGREAAADEELVRLRERQAEAMRRRVEQGSSSPLDLSRVQGELAAARLRAADTEARAARSLVQLAAAVGVPPGAIDESRLAWPDVEAPNRVAATRFDGCREAAIVARPSVARASLAYDQAEAALKSAVAAQYPSVYLGVGYTWERGLRKLPFSLGLALPSLDLNHAAIAAAEARRQEAGKALEAAVAEAGNSLDLAISDYRSAWRLLERTRRQAAIAKGDAARADRALKVGALNRVEWTGAQVTALSAALDELTAVGRVHEAEAALEDALRQPFDGPERAIAGTSTTDRDSACEFFSPPLQ